ncbi:DNA helicase [Tanacetum coccineum]
MWDESPMNDRRCFKTLDRTLWDILNQPDHLFGGKTVVLGGDFRQTLPVKKGASRNETIRSSIANSYLWYHFKIYYLTENMRLNNQILSEIDKHRTTTFARWLLDNGNGQIGIPDDSDPDNTSWVDIPDEHCIPNDDDGIPNLINFIYDADTLHHPSAVKLQEKPIVCPKNDTADIINNKILSLLTTTTRTYLSYDDAIPHTHDDGEIELLYPKEYLNSLSFPGLPPHNLTLKVGSPIMLLRNMNIAGGLCNGTRLIVSQLLPKVIEARIITGTRINQKVFLPRILLTVNDPRRPFIFRRKQFPVKVCYAMTINKAQGQSLKKIGIYLAEPVFGHGQLYVALSRATTPDGLKILINSQIDKPPNTTKNITNGKQQGTPIRANMDAKDTEYFEQLLQLHSAYRITGFSCEQTIPWERTLDNQTSLTFGKFISLQEIPNDDFPQHYFNFAAYNELPAKVNVKNTVLTGLQLSGTSATHYYLNPNIPETYHIKEQYQQLANTVPILNIDNQRHQNQEEENHRHRFPLATLLEVNPQNYQRARFTSHAIIYKISTQNKWYYERCTSCRNQVILGDPIPTCKNHGPQPTTTYSNQANSLIKDCNELLAELSDKNPYHLPPTLKELEESPTRLEQLEDPMKSQQEKEPADLPPLSTDMSTHIQALQSTPPQIENPTEAHKGSKPSNPTRPSARKALFKDTLEIESPQLMINTSVPIMKTNMGEEALDLVIPYIHNVEDRSYVSLVSRKFYEIDGITHAYIIRIAPWIQQLALEFRFLKELHIRHLVVLDEDLETLARTRVNDEIWLHELALNSTVLERLHVTDIDISNVEDLTLLAKNSCNSLISLKIGECYLSKLGDAFRYAVRLEHFGGYICDEESDLVGFRFPPNTCSLSIMDLPCLLFKRCPNLEVLSTEDVCGDGGLQVIGEFCKKLRQLTHFGRVTHVGLIALAKGCTNLESLDVIIEDISNEALVCVGTHLKNLRHFRICVGMENNIRDLPLDNGIQAMLMGCSKLERLHIIHIWHGGLTDVGLEYIRKYGVNLRSLALECVGNSNAGLVLSNAGLVKLSEGCPKLRKLELTNCGFSEQVATSFMFNMPSLRIFDRFLGGFIVNVELAAAFENRGLVPFALKAYQWWWGSHLVFDCPDRQGLKDRGDDVGLSMLLVDFKNAFNLVDRKVLLKEVCLRCPTISRWVKFCYSNPARLYYGEHILRSCQGVQQGDPLGPLLFALVSHPLICKIRDSFSLSLQAWYLDDGTIIGDTLVVGKALELIMKDGPSSGLHLNVDKTERVTKTIVLMDTVARINDPQCELLLLRACAGISKLYFAMRTCSPRVFEMAQHSFDAALRSSLERIVTAFGPGFGDWQWRLSTLPFAFGGLGVYYAGDVLNYAFLASRLSASLQTKLLRYSGIVASGTTFDDALCLFNTKIETDLLSNLSEIVVPKLMKKLTDIYFTRVTQTAESTFSLSSRQMALWQSQMEDHTSDWLRVVPIFGLGQTMNGKTYHCVLCYRLGVPLFSVSKPCSACSKVFTGDIYGDHAVSCTGIIGIKHRHNVVRRTPGRHLFWSGISVEKRLILGLTGMVDFVPGRAVIDAAHRKRVKYEAKCANIGYGFLPFSFFSLGELEKDAVTLLRQIRKLSVTQDIGACTAIHIFNRIIFAIAKGVGAQLCLKEHHIHYLVIHDEDLETLTRTRGKDLRSLKIKMCKGFSTDALMHVSKCCNQLRTLCLKYCYHIEVKDAIWLHQLALNSMVLERFHVTDTDISFVEDLTLLTKNYCNSLISLKIRECYLSKLGDAFRYAVRLEHFGGYICDAENELVGLDEDQQCLLFKSCTNLEVLYTEDVCGDTGLQVIGKFCKKLRKLTHKGVVTHVGLISLAKGCTNLESLHVILEDISSEALECLGIHLKNMCDFRIWLSKKDDVGLEYIWKYGANLMSLSLIRIGNSNARLVKLSQGYVWCDSTDRTALALTHPEFQL